MDKVQSGNDVAEIQFSSVQYTFV